MRSMNREELSVFLDATQKVCSFCDALHCDTCQISNLVTKYKNAVSDKEKAYADAEWVYETGREEPEILGSGSNFYSVAYTKDETEAFELVKQAARNYIDRTCYVDGKRVRQWYDFHEKKWCDC